MSALGAAPRPGLVARISEALGRAARWPFARRRRFLLLMWLVAMFSLGSGAAAYGDDLFTPPHDQGTGDTATPFERYETGDYDFLYAPDSNNDGVSGLGSGMLDGVEDGLFYVGASLIRGALIAMQWMLGLDLYGENEGQINSAIQSLANSVLIPLLGTTLIIGGVTAYARAKREGGGTIFNDVTWVVAATLFALGFGLFPGTVVGLADEARQGVATVAMAGYSAFGGSDGNALGVSNGGDLAGNPQCGQSDTCSQLTVANSARRLSNSLWDAWVNTPWCYAQFRSLDACKAIDPNYDVSNAGVLLDSKLRADLVDKLEANYTEINEEERYEAWGGNDRWIRGMLGARLGVVLLFFIVSVPIALLLLGLTIIGLLAVVGLLLLVLVGPFFLALWVIPGTPRQIGMQWLHGVIAVLLQGILITLVLGAVSVLAGIINDRIGQYGYFMTSLLMVVVLVTAWRMRSQLEGFSTGGNSNSLAMSTGGISSYTAWRAMGAVGRAGKGAAGGARSVAGSVGGLADRAAGGTGSMRQRPRRQLAPLAASGSPTAAVPDAPGQSRAPGQTRAPSRTGGGSGLQPTDLLSVREYQAVNRRAARQQKKAGTAGPPAPAPSTSSAPRPTSRDMRTYQDHVKAEKVSPELYPPGRAGFSRRPLAPLRPTTAAPNTVSAAPSPPRPVNPVQERRRPQVAPVASPPPAGRHHSPPPRPPK